MRICISSGHGRHIRGARGEPVPPNLDEVNEARRVVEHVADYLSNIGVEVLTFHDDISHTQSENLDRIVDWHNSQGEHDYDVSIHFNAYAQTDKPMGTEVLWLSESLLAAELSEAIAAAGGFIDRGAKYRDDLKFLNATHEKSVLIETCFCDSVTDSGLYNQNFDAICDAIAAVLGGGEMEVDPDIENYLFRAKGRCSYFGGPDDDGVTSDEGLAFLDNADDAPHLFLPEQPSGTQGLARRLNPNVFYVACRWDYDLTHKDLLADGMYQAVVRAGSKEFLAWPADWGPHENTGRIADLSPALMAALGVRTDDVVEVFYPARTTG